MIDINSLVRALEGALRQLSGRVDALRAALAGSRTAFVSARASTLAAPERAHAALAAQVQDGEQQVAKLRTSLCAALGEPADARMRALLARLAPASARSLGEAAAELRRALQGLRVESAVAQRLLDVTRRAQSGLLQALGTAAGTGVKRYDRHARSVRPSRSGDVVRGTI